MALVRESFPDREAWLKGRNNGGIGASSAASAVGKNKWQTNVELWELLTGKRKGKELIGSSSQYIEFGNKVEPIMRELFKIKHPEIKVTYNQYDILYQDHRPWLRATLDGECVTDEPKRFGARNGILEIKSAHLNTKAQWDEWNGKIPTNYLCQCCHQLLATEWDYVYLFAILIGQTDWTIREYYLDKLDFEPSMEWLLKEETDFWGYVERNEKPAEKLPDIFKEEWT